MILGNAATVIGAGYVGLVTATLLAHAGIKTYVLDVMPKKIATINKGRSPFFEPGLDELIKQAIANKMLVPTTSYKHAIPNSNFIFFCVGTPDRADGSSNLDYVFQAIETAAEIAMDGTVFIQKSTVPVGTARKLIATIKKKSPTLHYHYVSNPEFLREGSAIHDTLYPDRTVLGGTYQTSLKQVAGLYKLIAKAAPHIDPVFQKQYQKPEDGNGAVIYTTLESAELIKVTANAFLALKISFANSIAKLCDAVGADIKEVMDGIGKDKRIGGAFLNAGRGYGGGCFPKDVSGLIATADENGLAMEVMAAAVQLNESMPAYIVAAIENELGNLSGQKVAVLGLAFKAGTSDSRRSPAITIANLLAERGARVTAYDPKAIIEEGGGLSNSISRKATLNEAVINADAAVVATDWPEFSALDYPALKK